jgi:soluble lytic murein transglycosylase-like protein
VGTLRRIAGAFALACAAPADGQSVGRWDEYIEEASSRFGIPADWVRRVIRAESGGQTMLHGRAIVSRAGAMGLMQLMPGTWAEMRALHGLGPDPHDPRDNILAGAAYLRAMYGRFGYPGLFAAYNAGPARYARHLSTGSRLPAETITYVATVTRDTAARPALPCPVPQSTLFAVSTVAKPIPGNTEPPAADCMPDALFVWLSSSGLP